MSKPILSLAFTSSFANRPSPPHASSPTPAPMTILCTAGAWQRDSRFAAPASYASAVSSMAMDNSCCCLSL
jgi:hypothetical protein